MTTAVKTSSSPDLFARAETAAEFLRSRTALRPRIAVVLGSGLGAFADELQDATRIPYGEIPGFPIASAVGHAGQLVVGTIAGTVAGRLGSIPIAVMQGRAHYYEGHSISEATFPMRALNRFGVKSVILTNAAGGINLKLSQGCLVALSDHINLMGSNPLIGPNDDRFGPRFPDMTQAYSRYLREIAMQESGRLGIELATGTYAAVHGPSYETPAEIHFLRTIGADVVGMSTVPEVIVARHMGMEVLAISCVTNMAAGVLDQPIDHEEVLATGERVREDFSKLLSAIIPRVQELLNQELLNAELRGASPNSSNDASGNTKK